MTSETEPEENDPFELLDIDELLGENGDTTREELIGAIQGLLSDNLPTVEERAEVALSHVHYEQETYDGETITVDEFLVPRSADMAGVETWVDGSPVDVQAYKAELFDQARNNGSIIVQCQLFAAAQEQDDE